MRDSVPTEDFSASLAKLDDDLAQTINQFQQELEACMVRAEELRQLIDKHQTWRERIKRAITSLLGNDEPQSKGQAGRMETPMQRYESESGIDTLSMPGRNPGR